MNDEQRFTYKQAGVDVEAGNRAVDLLKQRLKSTQHPLVLGGLGGFGGAMALPKLKDPVLVAGTDGVGTKIEIARTVGRLDTIGIDLVAMSVNDVSACGAVPLFFLDYLVVGKVVPEEVAEIVAGVDEGCLRAECVLLGGETAEHPGQFPGGDFDMAGFAVGVAERDGLWGPHLVKDGDALIGICSSGLHSNGFSLVRHLLKEHAIDLDSKFLSEGGAFCLYRGPTATVGDVLLIPTAIYSPLLRELGEAGRSARRRAHHRRRLPRQRRPRGARRARGRARPLVVVHGPCHQVAALAGRRPRRAAQDVQLRSGDGRHRRSRARRGCARHHQRARARGPGRRTRRPAGRRRRRSATKGRSACEAARPHRLRRPQPRPDLPPAAHVLPVGRAGSSRHRAARRRRPAPGRGRGARAGRARALRRRPGRQHHQRHRPPRLPRGDDRPGGRRRGGLLPPAGAGPGGGTASWPAAARRAASTCSWTRTASAATSSGRRPTTSSRRPTCRSACRARASPTSPASSATGRSRRSSHCSSGCRPTWTSPSTPARSTRARASSGSCRCCTAAPTSSPRRRSSRCSAGSRSPSRSDFILNAGVGLVVCKMGGRGARLVGRRVDLYVPPLPTEVVDVTGAGDLFAAGFLAGMMEGVGLEGAGRLAAWAASRGIAGVGRSTYPDAEQWRARLAEERGDATASRRRLERPREGRLALHRPRPGGRQPPGRHRRPRPAGRRPARDRRRVLRPRARRGARERPVPRPRRSASTSPW